MVRYLNKKKIQLMLLTVFILGLIPTISLFLLYLNPIRKTIVKFEGDEYIVSILLIRMVLLLLMSGYLFNQWLNQEQQFYSDIPFLFGLFFLLMFFGKAYDLLHDLTYFFIDNMSFLIILKLRFIIMVLSITPMYYLSIGMILFFLSLSEKYTKFNDMQFSKRVQLICLICIISFEIIIILLFLTVETSALILPAIVIPSFLIIVLIFFFAYKNQRLSQINPLILTIAFAAYLISQISRPLLQTILGENPSYIFFAELIDLVIFSFIFLGLIKKIEY